MVCLLFAAMLSVTPVPQSEDAGGWWQKRLAEKRKLVEAGGSKVVFLGDSITHYFENGGSGMGKTVWDKYWAGEPYKALNLGFGGDKTENLLWRITEGRELDGYEAKAIVLMIGVNNIGQRNDPAADVICGVKWILEVIRAKQPKAKTVLCAILPIGEKADNPCRLPIATVNRELQKYADGRHVIWCDFSDRFLLPDGSIPRDILPDFVHPREEGYYCWTAALLPLVNAILRDDGLPIASVYPSRLCGKALTPTEPREALRPVTRICQPSWRGTDWWGDRLARNRSFIRDHRERIDFVFAGSSSVHFWESNGAKEYAALTNRYVILNCGYGGDQTQNLLWRLENGELDGYRAKGVVLSIGSNNNGVRGAKVEDTVAGIRACMDVIARKQPQAKIVLLAYTPRAVGSPDGDPGKDGGANARNLRTNGLVRELADGRNVYYVDVYDRFLKDGKLPKSLSADRIHPTTKGYRIIREALEPVLERIMKENGR